MMIIVRWGINSLAALLLLTGLWWLLQQQSAPVPKPNSLQIRQFDSIALPPPPAPPPTTAQTQPSAAVNLSLTAADSEVRLTVTPLEITLPKISAPTAMGHTPVLEALQFDLESVVAAITTFRLDELDEMPRLLTPISARLPASLRQQGVRQAQLQLHVIIHENGNVELVKIQQAQYPELKQLVQQIVQQARFSAPHRQGSKVKAEFLWPLKVSA